MIPGLFFGDTDGVAQRAELYTDEETDAWMEKLPEGAGGRKAASF
jgi:hypothetical protein